MPSKTCFGAALLVVDLAARLQLPTGPKKNSQRPNSINPKPENPKPLNPEPLNPTPCTKRIDIKPWERRLPFGFKTSFPLNLLPPNIILLK